ncbi:MAG: 16S rRNA (guanine(966)-N(2))-methyltransferase RsmD [Kiritimatiellae bacterium]|nr:16S rRNA (guanine(966)-N(2))-methyltransferase RsmD [Kiritimatiellia bacterium]
MRITGGTLCGRRLRVPAGFAVRPTQDRVREAFFASQTARIAGASFLDLFSGTGAVGIEAWSRGATRVCMVERDRRAFETVQRNMLDLSLSTGDCRAVRCDVERFLEKPPREGAFDLVYADPPYAAVSEMRGRPPVTLAERLFCLVAKHGWLAADGIFVMETGARESLKIPTGWACLAEKRYGKATLWVCKQKD